MAVRKPVFIFMQRNLLLKYFADFISWISWRRSLLMIAIVLISEFVVLVPAYFSHERDVLDRLSIVGKATISSTFLSQSHSGMRDMLLRGDVIARHSIVRGGAIYQPGGKLLGKFGEPPTLPVSNRNDHRYIASEGRYEFVLQLEHSGLPLTIVSRVDATGLPQAVSYRLKQTAMIVLAFAIILIFTCVAIIQRRSTEKRSEREFQEALVESERHYRQLIESIPGAVYVQVDGRIVFVNFAAQRMFGAESSEELIGLSSTDLFHPDDRHKITARRNTSRLSDGALPFIEVRHLRLDGTVFEGEATSTKIVWEGDAAILVEIRDITDRKLAERIAQKNQDQYRQFMELMPDAVFIHCNDKVVFANPATVKMFGAETANDIIGKSALDLSHRDDWERIRTRRLNLQKGRPFKDFEENRYIRLDGGQFQGESRASQITWNNEPGILVAIRDITERKEIETALENAKTAAETSNRTKSEFLANMSHELRTPLNAVIGFSEIFMQQMMGPLGNDKYQDYATDIHNSGKHLLNLINDILDISKIESGEARLIEEDVEVDGIVDSTLRLLETRANTNQIKIVANIETDLPMLCADQRKLKQILINLVSNAVKFSNVGGQVDVRVWSGIDDGFVIQVEDSGIGIALQDIPKALAPFQQVDSDLSRTYDGTGLGLPLTKSLVELHGGSLNLDSQIGVGTTVTVRFPASRIVSKSEFMDLSDLDISGVA